MSSIVLHLPVANFSKSKKRQSEISSGITEPGVKVCPCLVDFGRLLKNPAISEVIPGIPNIELLHAAAALYAISLVELTDEMIYPVVTNKWSRTLLVVVDESQAEEKLKRSLTSLSGKDKEEILKPKSIKSLQNKRAEIKESESDQRIMNIFSDDEDSDPGEDDNDVVDDNNYMEGVDSFLQAVDKRRQARHQWSESYFKQTEGMSPDRSDEPPLGIENRLIACATFERSYQKPGEKVLLLTLIAVRRKYRGRGIGSYIIQQILDPTVTGGSDVIVVNADINAIEFFEKQGFSDDVILNSRYAHIGDSWYNSKRMIFIWGYTQDVKEPPIEGPNYYRLREMDLEISLWKEKSMQSYQSYSSIVHRMRREILALHAKVNFQAETIARLQRELDAKNDQKLEEEQDKMRRRISSLRSAINNLHVRASSPEYFLPLTDQADVSSVLGNPRSKSPQRHIDNPPPDTTKQRLLSSLISKDQPGSSPITLDDDRRSEDPTYGKDTSNSIFENKCRPNRSTSPSIYSESWRSTAPVDHMPVNVPKFVGGSSKASEERCPNTCASDRSAENSPNELLTFFLHEIKHSFLTSINGSTSTNDGNTKVLEVIAASLPPEVTSRFNDAVKLSQDPDMVANLYFCGGKRHITCGFDRIMRNGFGSEDYVKDEYGVGLHFSRHAKCAAQFSPRDRVLVATVCLGHNLTITASCPERQSPPNSFDSVLTPGRFSSSLEHDIVEFSEYIVYESSMAMPIALVLYKNVL